MASRGAAPPPPPPPCEERFESGGVPSIEALVMILAVASLLAEWV